MTFRALTVMLLLAGAGARTEKSGCVDGDTRSECARHAGIDNRIAAFGRVQGTVYDSLRMESVAHAVVWVSGSTHTVVANDVGVFELDSVPVGKQFIAFSSPALDSTGLSTLGSVVNVAEGKATQTELAVPAFATVWRAMCGNKRTNADSGIVWGTVRDAKTDIRQSGATVSFTWYEVKRNAKKKLEFGQNSQFARTDSTGTYYQCGLPVEQGLISESEGTLAASGEVEYAIGNRHLFRLDMLVSTEMVVQLSNQSRLPPDSLAAFKPLGSSMLRGTVTDDHGKPMSDVIVTVTSANANGRTNKAGEFFLTDLPAGTHALEVRFIGFSASHQTVDLKPQTETKTSVVMQSSQTLAVFNVNASTILSADRLAFLERKKTQTGYFLEQPELVGTADLIDIVEKVPGYNFRMVNGLPTPLWNLSTRECIPTFYYDGVEMPYEQIAMHKNKDVRGVEVYPPIVKHRQEDASDAPLKYRSFSGCGSVLVWSKFSRWK